jgi:low affinity Fe/Cu permease
MTKSRSSTFKSWFTSTAAKASNFFGTPYAFAGAVFIVFVWLITGPYFHYSNTWQLIINTGTTIVTFLMVFLIQNTQNRDARAIHLKLDELIYALYSAHNEMIDIEKLSDDELENIAKRFERIRETLESRRKKRSTLGDNGHAANHRTHHARKQ